MNKERPIDLDIFRNLAPSEGGDSIVVTLDPVTSYSCQAIFDVVTLVSTFADDTDVDVTNNTLKLSASGPVPAVYKTGTVGRFTTTGTLPAGLALATDYYLVQSIFGVYKVATSLANAKAGIVVDITDTGSAAGVGTFTPKTLSGGAVTFYKSNNGINWDTIEASTAITVDGTHWLEVPVRTYRYFKAVKAVTAGNIDLAGLTLGLQ